MDLTISLIDAITGSNPEIKTLDGKQLKLKIGPGTQYGTVFKIPNFGMYIMTDHQLALHSSACHACRIVAARRQLQAGPRPVDDEMLRGACSVTRKSFVRRWRL